jgi:hypothetical protein
VFLLAAQSQRQPQQRRRPLTPQQRRRCAAFIAGLSGGVTTAILGDFELAFALVGGGAGRGARVGRAWGTPGIVVGGIIGITLGYGTYLSREGARVNQLCRSM